jgi:hypothetical protein
MKIINLEFFTVLHIFSFNDYEKGFFFFYFHSGGWNQGLLDTATTNGLLCQPRVIMIMEKSVE